MQIILILIILSSFLLGAVLGAVIAYKRSMEIVNSLHYEYDRLKAQIESATTLTAFDGPSYRIGGIGATRSASISIQRAVYFLLNKAGTELKYEEESPARVVFEKTQVVRGKGE